MPKRPRSVTVVSWFIIVSSVFSTVAVPLSLRTPEAQAIMAQSLMPIWLQYIFTVIGLIIGFTCGVMMLRGRDWSRKLYVGWSVFGMIIGIFTSPSKMTLIPGVIILCIFAFILFRPPANAFFKGTPLSSN